MVSRRLPRPTKRVEFRLVCCFPSNGESTAVVHYVKLQIPQTGTPTLFDMPLQGGKLSKFADADYVAYWAQVTEFLRNKYVRSIQPEEFLVVQACHTFEHNCEELDRFVRSGDQEILHDA